MKPPLFILVVMGMALAACAPVAESPPTPAASSPPAATATATPLPATAPLSTVTAEAHPPAAEVAAPSPTLQVTPRG
ncbi:MAG: hypothetical protein WHV44_14885, partial [Anaerolineales bacterium]